jgi:hypothetical protein
MSSQGTGAPPPEQRRHVDWSDPEVVWLSEGQVVDSALRHTMVSLLPSRASMGYNNVNGRWFVEVSKPGNTRTVLNAALAQLGRPQSE